MNDNEEEILITRHAGSTGKICRTTAIRVQFDSRTAWRLPWRYVYEGDAFPVAEREAAIADAKARIAKEIAKTEKRLNRLRKMEIREVQA